MFVITNYDWKIMVFTTLLDAKDKCSYFLGMKQLNQLYWENTIGRIRHYSYILDKKHLCLEMMFHYNICQENWM